MESFKHIGFAEIICEALKIFCNGKLMTSLSLLTLSLNSIFYLSQLFFIQPFFADFLDKLTVVSITNPKTHEFYLLLMALKKDIQAFVGLEWIYALVSTLPSLFLTIAIIISASMFHDRKNLSFKELMLLTLKSLKRPFFTSIYITILNFGFIFLVLANLLPMVLVLQHPFASNALSAILVILALALKTYLNTIWTSGFVVSVLEEKSGVEALGKAAQIVKGMKLHGFLMNLLFTILTFIIFLGDMSITAILGSAAVRVTIGLFVTILISLVNIVWLVAYTVFYFQGKKIHGEEVELLWSIEYSKVPSLSLVEENIP